MSIASQMKAALARSNELDMKLARRIGEHIDKTAAGLGEIIAATEEKALPPGIYLIPEAPKRRKLTKAFANQVVSQNKLKLTGITAAKKLPLNQYVAWLAEREVDVIAVFNEALLTPSFVQLAAFWRAQGSPPL